MGLTRDLNSGTSGDSRGGHKHPSAEDQTSLNMETKTFVQSFDFLPERAKRYAEIGFQTYKKDLLNLTEACEFLTLSRSSLYRSISAGRIPVRPVAGIIRFDLVELSLIKSGEDSPYFILPTQPTTQDTPKKRRGRIPASNNSDELLAILNS